MLHSLITLTNTFINENYLTGIVKTDISNHFPVFFLTETILNKTKQSNFVFEQNISDVNLNHFNEALIGLSWDNVL